MRWLKIGFDGGQGGFKLYCVKWPSHLPGDCAALAARPAPVRTSSASVFAVLSLYLV